MSTWKGVNILDSSSALMRRGAGYWEYPIQKVTEIHNKVTQPYNFLTELSKFELE
jgi:hypothetical protein